MPAIAAAERRPEPGSASTMSRPRIVVQRRHRILRLRQEITPPQRFNAALQELRSQVAQLDTGSGRHHAEQLKKWHQAASALNEI